jgi:diguanylate cyclase (GGDEF)-like protein
MSIGLLSWAAEHPLNLLMLVVFSLACALGGLVWSLRLRRRGSVLSASLDAASTQLGLLSQRDVLTGLLGREEFELALDRAASGSDGAGQSFCLLYIDIDNLRTVNDTYGHAVGDEVLRLAAARLLATLSSKAAATSRIAADEFAIILPGSLDRAHLAAQSIAMAFERPLAAADGATRLSCSIGIAAYPQHGSRPRLMGNAVLAMRSVKHAGGDAYADYDPRLGVAHREQSEMLKDLGVALERRQFELFYQPKMDARSLQVTAAEALLRWHHPERGVISPAVFIPLAERYGLIGDIGDWVIDEACRQAAIWRENGLRMRVAVNISGVQLRRDDLAERIQTALLRHGIPASRLTCEITESVAMEDTRLTRQAFEQLRRTGVHVSIDDFGTGHSSLASLRRLPAAELKIDRAFVCDLEGSADARAIAAAIVQMAHRLDLRVVAEGVETEAQRDLLVKMGCDELQGYLFAKPMTSQALALWADDDRPGEAGAFRPSLFQETQPG